MQKSQLPGITRIDFVKCNDLPRYCMLDALGGVTLALAIAHTQISFVGEATLSWEASVVNGGPQEKSTLEFKTTEHLPTDNHLAFIVTTATGKQYLVGTHEKRYPVITYSDTTGTVTSSPSVRSYKITHVAIKSVLECIL